MSGFKKIVGRKLYIDFTGIPDTEQDGFTRNMLENCRKAHMREKALKAVFPYQHILGKRRIVEDPAQLQDLIDEYWNSCEGPLIDKYGQVVRDDDGHIVYVQTKPYTLSGLAAAIGMSTCTLRGYNWKSLAGVVHPEFSEVIMRARQRIEQYAEEQLYDKDGQKGAQFSLQAAFSWTTKKEQSEIARNIASIKKMQQDFELQKQKMKLQEELLKGADNEDNNITINIVRATKKDNTDN